MEYHPYTLSHLEPVLAIHAKHGIVTTSFGPLTPSLRHPTGGPLKPILARITERLTTKYGEPIDSNTVLLLWTKAQGVVAITTSANADRIKNLGKIAQSNWELEQSEIDEITRVGKTIHYRNYVSEQLQAPCKKKCLQHIVTSADGTYGSRFPSSQSSKSIDAKRHVFLGEYKYTWVNVPVLGWLSERRAFDKWARAFRVQPRFLSITTLTPLPGDRPLAR
jgi:hypothetical protein